MGRLHLRRPFSLTAGVGRVVTGTGCNVAFSNAYNAAHSAWEQSVAMALVMQVTCLLLCTAGTGGFGLFFCAAGCL
jgi:hypothetical protein